MTVASGGSRIFKSGGGGGGHKIMDANVVFYGPQQQQVSGGQK